MANTVTGITKAIGLALIVVGAGMIFWGYQLSDSISSQLTESLSGSMPDEVMIRYIGGAASLIVGLFLSIRR
jgi:hypothetical protein